MNHMCLSKFLIHSSFVVIDECQMYHAHDVFDKMMVSPVHLVVFVLFAVVMLLELVLECWEDVWVVVELEYLVLVELFLLLLPFVELVYELMEDLVHPIFQHSSQNDHLVVAMKEIKKNISIASTDCFHTKKLRNSCYFCASINLLFLKEKFISSEMQKLDLL